ncbi:hypothetical protein [Kitasatospora sp. NPDC058046]|uniref:hypothetical protein n=1 Tax=Kitasatospora sp. NPDC058046 TaxID=3346312 RepID=UPI0036DD55CB
MSIQTATQNPAGLFTNLTEAEIAEFTTWLRAIGTGQPSTFQNLSEVEAVEFIVRLQAAATDQPREHENSDLCQTLSAVMRNAARLYGTAPFVHQHCICFG